MHIIICLDDDNGMLFHDRRQSQDVKLRADVLERLGERMLWMNAYSARQFADAEDARIHISDSFLEEANTGKGIPFPRKIRFYVQYILPIIILIIWIQGYIAKFILK